MSNYDQFKGNLVKIVIISSVLYKHNNLFIAHVGL